ncbi:MAG: glycoside hydrolase family 2 [Chitinophagaceae bacterium]|nr:glycoside hydrolase family 2 [Chitinophagaceae bacterium]MCA6453406.1 glycoside hydrolase family 2 [Chitinophagaceae bacterium]MCA6456393.1 glycoside hydrolase family 2 [Chitinophagaceae bacterium]MCA6458093.1 glycoside hydrolase family 2 [Chitinophagaceae bacterium]MCA6463806.1 glycoside hydrolase family 2 [Chitinophagaceae bacterium]
MKIVLYSFWMGLLFTTASAQVHNLAKDEKRIYLDSREVHGGNFNWVMKRSAELSVTPEEISRPGFATIGWMPAVVPGTVLNSLVYNKQYPEPYYGINNKLSSKLIPDIAQTGRDFYTYWFRTELMIPASFKEKNIWLQVDGINYRAEVWVNGNQVMHLSGMFRQDQVDIADFAKVGETNAIAIRVYPVDIPGTNKAKPWRARGENRNGGDGNIGLNTTMLMSVGWDFTFKDGIRDRNTGIWKSISLYATNKVALRHPFVRSELAKPNYDRANETISVELFNVAMKTVKCVVKGEIVGEGIQFEKSVDLLRGEDKTITFTASDFPQLSISRPRLWWPVHKGKPELYELKLVAYVDGVSGDSVRTRFGIREIRADRNTPDSSKTFYVNGRKIFIRGTNWIPEAMLRTSDERTYAELRYTRQSGVNLLRLWGGGIAESDYFYQLCDELGLLVWQEFWLTGDTKHPNDKDLYFSNLSATIKRIRNHPSVAFYVASNESTEVSGIREVLNNLDGTRPYQMQSEVDGVHDGSPYQQVNPMQHYENTASARGSRVDGFNPEYGAPSLPTVEALREMMDEKDLWPINKAVWDYLDGDAFHGMTGKFKDLVDNYGTSVSIDEFAKKAQLLNAVNARSVWEVWNANKFGYGDRYCSGLLFWYHNSPTRQVCGRMWDWSLEPTSALYYTQQALEPLHAQFDYLKNTVSVSNDYFRSFINYRLTAEVYDLNSKKVFSRSVTLDSIPEDAVLNNLITIDFGQQITPVHFIRLLITDEKGLPVTSSFYWRSNNTYQGKQTLTGPASAGFEPLSHMKTSSLRSTVRVRKEGKMHVIDIDMKNTSKQIAFFTQLQLLDGAQKPVRPSFYTDNFFSLLPGEIKHVSIETAAIGDTLDSAKLVVKGWNTPSVTYELK